VHTRRRLSEAISEGEAISTLVRVRAPAEATAAEAAGAEAVATDGVVDDVRGATGLPILVAGATPQDVVASGADAWLLVAEMEGDDLEQRHMLARELGLECVVDVRDEEELEAVLERIDPEIVLLSPRSADDEEEAVDRILELLPDVPAGKLVAAELQSPTEDELHALERAGVDAVLVRIAAFTATN
jgi:indole-3-glycerol phosphate synthase